jgi:hypothetical protein
MFDFDTKEKEHQNTWQSDLSDGLLFQCSFSYLALAYFYFRNYFMVISIIIITISVVTIIIYLFFNHHRVYPVKPHCPSLASRFFLRLSPTGSIVVNRCKAVAIPWSTGTNLG